MEKVEFCRRFVPYVYFPGCNPKTNSSSWSSEADEMFTSNIANKQGGANLKTDIAFMKSKNSLQREKYLENSRITECNIVLEVVEQLWSRRNFTYKSIGQDT